MATSDFMLYLFVKENGDVWYSTSKDGEPTYLCSYPIFMRPDGSYEVSVPLPCLWEDLDDKKPG